MIINFNDLIRYNNFENVKIMRLITQINCDIFAVVDKLIHKQDATSEFYKMCEDYAHCLVSVYREPEKRNQIINSIKQTIQDFKEEFKTIEEENLVESVCYHIGTSTEIKEQGGTVNVNFAILASIAELCGVNLIFD